MTRKEELINELGEIVKEHEKECAFRLVNASKNRLPKNECYIILKGTEDSINLYRQRFETQEKKLDGEELVQWCKYNDVKCCTWYTHESTINRFKEKEMNATFKRRGVYFNQDIYQFWSVATEKEILVELSEDKLEGIKSQLISLMKEYGIL